MRIFLIISFLSCLWIFGKTQDTLPFSPQKQLVIEEGINKYYLSSYIDIIADTFGHATLDDVFVKFQESKLLPIEELDRVPNNQVNYYWLRFRIQSQLQKEKELYFCFNHPEVEFYVLKNGVKIQQSFTGTHRERASNALEHISAPLIPFLIPAKEKLTILVKVASKLEANQGYITLQNTDRKLMDGNYLKNYQQNHLIKMAFCIGIVFTVGIYHLILFYYNREWAYVYLSFTCFILVYGIGFYGDFYQYYFSITNQGFFNDYINGIFYIIYPFGIIPYTNAFLEIKNYSVKLKRFLNINMILAASFGIIYLTLRVLNYEWFLVFNKAVINYWILYVIFFNALPFFSGFYILRRGNKNAVTYLYGMGFLFFVGLINMIDGFDIISLPELYPKRFGISVAALFLSFGLAKRFKTLQEDRNIAEKEKVLAEQQQQMQEQEAQRLKELDETKNVLYTNITHEFRTPLTVIQGMTKEIVGNKGEKASILRNTQYLLQMVNQMLDLSKLESSTMKINYVQDNIIPFLHYQTEAWSSFANTKLISLNFYTNLENLEMDFDAEKIEQILTNLLSNALKFTPEYGKIQVAAEKQNSQLVIIIKDTGIGIAPEKLPYIFDRFYQTDASSTRKGEGTGIGLALVKELIDLMVGKIEVQSETLKGTTFKVYLPIHNQAKKENVIFEPEVHLTASLKTIATKKTDIIQDGQLPQLLIIEDNQDVITYLKTCLKRQYQIFTAPNGKEGVLIAQKELPDIILCDVMMPEMDGFEVCQLLKESNPTSHIPIILLTAKATQADKKEGLSYGADAYLTKPFDKEELLIRLENLISIRKKLHARFAQGLISKKSDQVAISIKDQTFLNKLTQFIKDHIEEEDLEVIHLQKAVGMSRAHLYKKLKALTGLSTSQFRKTVRLQEGKKFLLSGDNLTISEVAYKVGYKHPSHFSRDFKIFFKVPPGHFKTNQFNAS